MSISPSHIRLQQVSSTNEFAAFLVSKINPPHGSVISAENQHAGRGQVGRKWHSSTAQNATFSVVLYPSHIVVRDQFVLNKIVSVAVRTYIAELLPEEVVEIKWPNDIYVNQKKIAGILIQVSIVGNELAFAICGVGVNVNEQNFPTQLPNPTRLSDYSNELPEICALIDDLASQIKWIYQRVVSGELSFLNRAYLTHLYRKDQPTQFKNKEGKKMNGIIRGVNQNGKLIVETVHGLETFGMAEIQMLDK